MAITNTFTITYGSQSVGGSSNIYLLHGPYVIDKSFETLRLVFDVVVVADSYANLQSYSNTVETAFRKRNQTLAIDIDGTAWTYTYGTNILNTVSSCAKAGSPETDRGFSRAYTVSIEGDLPADESNSGLRDIETHVNYESSRQKVVTMRGIYTAVSGSSASAKYIAAFDAVAATLLTGIDSSATFELVDEQYTPDRNDHLCPFTRQYVQLLANQTQASLDASSIRDHRIVFTDETSHPGDSAPGVYRLRRILASYDCAIDIEVGTNLQTVFSTDVQPHLVALFTANYTPTVFGIEGHRIGYDETSKRMSVQMTFLYQAADGTEIVEVSESVTIREQQQIDYTPLHMKDVFAANVDPGFAVRERIAMRTVVTMGTVSAKERIGKEPLNKEGWNVVQNTSQVSRRYIGDLSTEEQILQTVLTETVVERFHKRPTGR